MPGKHRKGPDEPTAVLVVFAVTASLIAVTVALTNLIVLTTIQMVRLYRERNDYPVYIPAPGGEHRRSTPLDWDVPRWIDGGRLRMELSR